MKFNNRDIAYLSYECEGYNYEPWEDKDDDVIKIWHDIKTPGGDVIHGPWSPYKVPTLEQFVEFVNEYREVVRLGRPAGLLSDLYTSQLKKFNDDAEEVKQ